MEFIFFTYISPDYMGHDINKNIWKNMTAGFLQRRQNLLWYFIPEMMIFRHEKKILDNNNVIDFDPIKIQTCLVDNI